MDEVTLDGQSESVEDIVRRALFDPGQYVERDFEDHGDSYPGKVYEPLHVWQTKAVLAAFDSMNGLQAIAKAVLDRHYPADISLVCDRDSPDPGPRLTAALRDCIEAQEAAR
jgi:hypothetical protein